MEKIGFKELMKLLESKLPDLNHEKINSELVKNGWTYNEFIADVIWSRKLNNKIIDILLTT
jgi:hypothetical protein